MALQFLEPVYEVVEPEPFAGPDHPLRVVTREAAFDGRWDGEIAARIAGIFDELAPEWDARKTEHGALPMIDALDRGGPFAADARVVELGAGTGYDTQMLADRFDTVAVLDLSAGMLAHGRPEIAQPVRGDSSALPFAADSVDVLVLVNMFLFPAEVDTVLAPDGSIIWINSLSDQTPIHLPSEDVLAALPGEWNGVGSRAHTGTWLVAQRA